MAAPNSPNELPQQTSSEGPTFVPISEAEMNYRIAYDHLANTDPTDPPDFDLIIALMDAHIAYARETGLGDVAVEQWLSMLDAAEDRQEPIASLVQTAILGG